MTPSVNAGNMVTLQINQAVTDVGEIDAATGQRAFLQRQIGSKVAVRSGESLVLGGLIRDNATTGSSGVPVLHEIPVFGALFGTKTIDGSAHRAAGRHHPAGGAFRPGCARCQQRNARAHERLSRYAPGSSPRSHQTAPSVAGRPNPTGGPNVP